jgi:hypothetical protein
MIVKCQRSLSTTLQYAQMLFYNRARDWMWQGDLTDDWNERFGKENTLGNAKFFAEVRWQNQKFGPPEFIRRVPDQSG